MLGILAVIMSGCVTSTDFQLKNVRRYFYLILKKYLRALHVNATNVEPSTGTLLSDYI